MSNVRIFSEIRKSFVYRQFTLTDEYQIIIGDIGVGEHNGIELYVQDIIKSNNKYYLISGYVHSKEIVLDLIQIKIQLNRCPTTAAGLYMWSVLQPTERLSQIPEEFELIGNIYNKNDLNL